MINMLKRNDIVGEKEPNGFFAPYGRIIKRVDSDHVLVVDCNKDLTIYQDVDLDIFNDYKGYHDCRNRYRRMSSLRKLKQMASRYHPEIWRKRKRK